MLSQPTRVGWKQPVDSKIRVMFSGGASLTGRQLEPNRPYKGAPRDSCSLRGRVLAFGQTSLPVEQLGQKAAKFLDRLGDLRDLPGIGEQVLM